MDTRLNRHLWFLTGRNNDFVTAALNTGISHGSVPPPKVVIEARRLLHLDVTTTDYYVIGAMAALVAARSDLVDAASVLFMPRTLHVKAPSIAGGELRAADTSHPSLLHRPSSLPAARTWYVQRISATLVRITTDTGYSSEALYREAAGVVYVDWPEVVGFHAAFAPTGGVWVDGSQVVISTEPSGYPYGSVAVRIRDSNALVRLLAVEGMLSQFHAARSGIQKVGALCVAIVKWGEKANPAGV